MIITSNGKSYCVNSEMDLNWFVIALMLKSETMLATWRIN